MYRILVFTTFLVIGLKLFAQKALNYKSFREKHPTEEGVMAEESDYVKMEVSTTGELVIKNHHQQRAIYFTDAGRMYADDYLYYSSFSSIDNITAKLFTSQGKAFDATEILTSDRQDGGIFFDDNKVKHIVYPHVDAPCQTFLEYDETISDPHYLSRFFFSNYIPTEERKVIFDIPETVSIRFKLFNETKNIIFSETRKKGRIIYSWEYKNVPKFTVQNNDFPISYYEPHIIPLLISYKCKDGEKRVIENMQDLYAWDYSHIAKIDSSKNNKEICNFADSLAKTGNNPEEKMNLIYYWVQQNIKYVAIEDGYSGIIPRMPIEVLHRRYGDCKDMSALLVNLLQCAGIDARLSWIGTRDIPYSFTEMPSPFIDNHMIVIAKIDNKSYFLDGTAVFLPSNLPSDFIQGKEALRGIDAKNYEIITVPTIDANQSTIIDSSFITLKGDTLLASARFEATGYEKFNYAVNLVRSDEEKQQNTLKKLLAKGNNKCEVSKVLIEKIEPREAPLVVTYQYMLPDYARKIGKDIYINLQLDKSLQNEGNIDTTKKSYGKMIDYKYSRKSIICLSVPQGYTVKNIPKETDINTNLYSFSSKYSYSLTDNKLYLENVITMNTLSLLSDQYTAWNKTFEQINKTFSNAIVLTKK